MAKNEIDIEGFKNFMVEEELSSNTQLAYIRGLKQYSRMFRSVDKSNILKYKEWLLNESGYQPQTINLRLTTILRYCEYKGKNIKVKLIKLPKKTHIENIITEKDYKKLITALKQDNIRYYVWVVLLGKTGMRISEAIRIKKKDIMNGSVDLHTKAHMRTIIFPESLKSDIGFWLDKLKDDDYVMQDKKGGKIGVKGVQLALKKFADRYSIPREVCHPHAFRHFFALQFAKRNGNIALLADLLGHGSINVTQIYLRQSREDQIDEINKAVDW